MTQRNPYPRAELVVVKPEANPMGHTELVPGAEPRNRTTPVEPLDPENWTKPEEEMGPGSQVGTSEWEDFRMGLKHPDGRTELA